MYYMAFQWLKFGGVETLTLREGKWFTKQKKKACVITQDISKEMKELYAQIGIEVRVVDKWTAKNIYKTIQSMETKVELIQFFNLRDFLDYKVYNPKHNVKIIYYCVHPIDDCYCRSSRSIGRFFNRILSKAISTYNKNKNIIYMDNDTLTANLENYHLEKERELFTILPLPYNIKNNPLHKRSKNEFHILSVARADFPFKGYLLGLIDELSCSFNEKSGVQCTIISTGRDYQVLEEKVKSLDISFKNCINIINGVLPDELGEFYYDTDLYIGMGTTILEAASYGVPSIIVSYGTYSFISNGLFNEEPMLLACKSNTENSNGIEYVKRIMNINSEQYQIIQTETVNALKMNYDENIIMERLDNWQCNNDYSLKYYEKFFIKVYYHILDRVNQRE